MKMMMMILMRRDNDYSLKDQSRFMHMQQARLACMDSLKSEQSFGRQTAAKAAAGKRCRTTTRTLKTNTRTTTRTAPRADGVSVLLGDSRTHQSEGKDDDEDERKDEEAKAT